MKKATTTRSSFEQATSHCWLAGLLMLGSQRQNQCCDSTKHVFLMLGTHSTHGFTSGIKDLPVLDSPRYRINVERSKLFLDKEVSSCQANYQF